MKEIIKILFLCIFLLSTGLYCWDFGWKTLPEVGSSVETTLTKYKGKSKEHIVSQRVDPYYSFSDKFYDVLIPYGIWGSFLVFFGLLGIFRIVRDFLRVRVIKKGK